MTPGAQLVQPVPRSESEAAENAAFAADVVEGLRATPKHIPPKYFYDAAGAALFEKITEQPEYYPTRTELRILQDNAAEIAGLLEPGSALIEFGSGSARKTRILLEAAKPAPVAYVPVDICTSMLEAEAARVRQDFPDLAVHPLGADFGAPCVLPPEALAAKTRVGFFPGSTIGNFEPHQAANFFRDTGKAFGAGSILIIGVDLVKPAEILHAAYNDAAGVTARFNLNLLTRINRELGANFHLKYFEHHAFYNRERSRIEMHLASTKRQKVRVAGEAFEFRVGETIHTENSYKYTVETFGALARGTGWAPLAVWKDADSLFSVQAFTFKPPVAAAR